MTRLTTKSVGHDGKLTPAEAIALQQRLRLAVITEDQLPEVKTVAGVDVGFEQEGRVARAAVVVLAFPELTVIEHAISHRAVDFPYIPGLLSFREVPVIMTALARLSHKPNLLLCDGQGLAHPRRFGLACHLGVLTDIPSIGVAKTRLIGTHEAVPDRKGAWQPLMHKQEQIGAVLRSRAHVKPIYISVGHRISLNTAIAYVMRCITRYRLPETTRLAHRLASH